MMMVVCIHVLGWGGVLEHNLQQFSTNWYWGNAMFTLSLPAVNSFVLISGYFFVYHQISFREAGIHMASGSVL